MLKITICKTPSLLSHMIRHSEQKIRGKKCNFGTFLKVFSYKINLRGVKKKSISYKHHLLHYFVIFSPTVSPTVFF